MPSRRSSGSDPEDPTRQVALSDLPALDGASAEQVAGIFRTLSSPVQLRLLDLLLDRERLAGECSERLGLSESQVLDQFGHLQERGYVAAREDSGRVRYRIADPRVTEIVHLSRSLTSGRISVLTTCDALFDSQCSPG